MRVLTFYTEGTGYEALAFGQELNIAEYNLNYTAVGIPDQGTWEANCAAKPFVILHQLETCTDDVFFIDVDARFASEPTEFHDLEHSDCEFVYPTWEKTGEVLSGSIYIQNCQNSIDFMKYWCSKQTDKLWDQHVMSACLEDYTGDLHTGELPMEYCTIFDSMPEITNPVIIHYQASRNLK